MSKLERHSNGSFSVTTDSGAKNIHVEVFAYIGELETKLKELEVYTEHDYPCMKLAKDGNCTCGLDDVIRS